MTKRLQEIFDLASSNEDDITTPLPEVAKEITETALTNIEKIESALPLVSGLEEADIELDELAQLATDSFKDLKDLGMNVESRFASEIFQAAGTMLGHAITAKTAKINKKLKMIDQQIKKAQLDMKAASKTEEIESLPVGEGQPLDRNQLIKMFVNKNEQQ